MIKQLIYTAVCFFISLLLANSSIAQSCDEKITAIYFGNGVHNTLAETELSRNGLVSAYLVKHDIREDYPNEKFVFDVAYNPTRGYAKDILEVINQKVAETGGLTATELLNLIKLSKDAAILAIKELSTGSGAGRVIFEIALEAVDNASDAYIESLKDDANGIGKYYQNITSLVHVDKYYRDLDNGKRVIVVAHSQGNLFANDAVEKVIAKDFYRFENSIGVVGVASPAGYLLDNHNNYITAHDDRVINALRLTHTVLPSNIDNDPGVWNDYRDWFSNHGFMLSYLASELKFDYATGDNTLRSRGKIDEMFLSLLSELEFPRCNDSPIINSVSPTLAALNQSTVFTVTGQNLPSTLQFWFEGCEGIEQLGGTSTAMQFRCIPKKVGDQEGTIQARLMGIILKEFTVTVSETPNPLPVVNFISPTEAVLGQSTTFTVTGQNLPSTLAFWIEECENVTSLGGTSTSRQFRCTPSSTIGLKDGFVQDKQDGTTLYNFQINVSDEPPVVSPVVNSVSPAAVILGVSTDFTVTGENLPSTLAFSVEDCINLQSLGGSSTYRQFRCTPSYTLGVKNGEIQDQLGGTVLKEFTVDVSEEPAALPVVYSVTPTKAVLDESTVFTVSGQDLPSTLSFWIGECENLTSLGGSSTSKQFRCTPSWTTGLKDGVVKDQSGGTVLYNFTVDVADAPVTSPVVYSVTPTNAVLDQSTTFTVSGQNLPSTLAFWIAECENLTSLGGTSTSRRFRCTPSWTTGLKDGVVKDQSGGTVLKEFSVNVSY